MAPDRKIGAAVVQLQRQVAYCMGQIKADDGTGRMPEPRDLLQVEGLAGAVLHARPDDACQARSVLGDGAFDRGHREGAIGLVGYDLDQRFRRIEAVEPQLRFQRVTIRRECAGFHQQYRALAGRPVEGDQHQVQVGGQRIHRHHFPGLRADHARQRVAHQLVVRHPLRLAGEVAFHGLRRPFVEHFLDMRARALRLQAQRVADEVGLRFAVMQRQVEFAAEVA